MIKIVEKSEDLPLWINAIVPPWPTCWWGWHRWRRHAGYARCRRFAGSLATVLALVGYLLWAAPCPALAGGTGASRALEPAPCGTLAGPAWLAPLLRAAALWLLWATVTQMLKIAGYTTGKNAKMPVVAAVPLAVYCVAHFSAVVATVASFAFIVFSIMLLWYAVLLLRAYNTTRVKK